MNSMGIHVTIARH